MTIKEKREFNETDEIVISKEKVCDNFFFIKSNKKTVSKTAVFVNLSNFQFQEVLKQKKKFQNLIVEGIILKFI